MIAVDIDSEQNLRRNKVETEYIKILKKLISEKSKGTLASSFNNDENSRLSVLAHREYVRIVYEHYYGTIYHITQKGEDLCLEMQNEQTI